MTDNDQWQKDRETIAAASPLMAVATGNGPHLQFGYSFGPRDIEFYQAARTRWPAALDEVAKVTGLEAQIDMLLDLRKQREVEIERLREENQDLEAELKDRDGLFNRNCELSQEIVPKLQAEIERLQTIPDGDKLVVAEMEIERLRAVMSEVGSMPGKDWLKGQLMLAEALHPTEGS